MKRLNVVVEGHAEEAFSHEVLREHFWNLGVIVATRRVQFSRKHGRIFRGGLVDYPLLKNDVQAWLAQDKGASVTTMVDLYGLPENFPGFLEAKKQADAHKRVNFLQASFAEDVGSRRFIPYIQLHEFEALLFIDLSKLASIYPKYSGAVQRLKEGTKDRSNPELINDHKDTSPSKRILGEIPIYEKKIAGPLIAIELGIHRLRENLPHFNQWISHLESLATSSAS